MGKKELEKRKNWQEKSGKKAVKAELNFNDVFKQEFINSTFELIRHPKDFIDIYEDVKLDTKTLDAIYNPNESWHHGIKPDYGIYNKKTGKTLYVEVKRQDGWVENKPRKAGRGNAHERSCKYFTPGLLKILREKSKIKDSLPFWVVFEGDIARDPKRVREITLWYDTLSSHFFMWHDSTDEKSIISHFNKKLRHLLE